MIYLVLALLFKVWPITLLLLYFIYQIAKIYVSAFKFGAEFNSPSVQPQRLLLAPPKSFEQLGFPLSD